MTSNSSSCWRQRDKFLLLELTGVIDSSFITKKLISCGWPGKEPFQDTFFGIRWTGFQFPCASPYLTILGGDFCCLCVLASHLEKRRRNHDQWFRCTWEFFACIEQLQYPASFKPVNLYSQRVTSWPREPTYTTVLKEDKNHQALAGLLSG